jgi:hypothetical protein
LVYCKAKSLQWQQDSAPVRPSIGIVLPSIIRDFVHLHFAGSLGPGLSRLATTRQNDVGYTWWAYHLRPLLVLASSPTCHLLSRAFTSRYPMQCMHAGVHGPG